MPLAGGHPDKPLITLRFQSSKKWVPCAVDQDMVIGCFGIGIDFRGVTLHAWNHHEPSMQKESQAGTAPA